MFRVNWYVVTLQSRLQYKYCFEFQTYFDNSTFGMGHSPAWSLNQKMWIFLMITKCFTCKWPYLRCHDSVRRLQRWQNSEIFDDCETEKYFSVQLIKNICPSLPRYQLCQGRISQVFWTRRRELQWCRVIPWTAASQDLPRNQLINQLTFFLTRIPVSTMRAFNPIQDLRIYLGSFQ